MTFGTFRHGKVRQEKSYFMLKITPHPPLSRSPFCLCLGDADRVCFANRSIPRWRRLSIRFFFCHRRRKRKSYQKEKRRYKDFALCGARQGLCPLTRKPPQRLDLNFNGKRCAKAFICARNFTTLCKIAHKKAGEPLPFTVIPYYSSISGAR